MGVITQLKSAGIDIFISPRAEIRRPHLCSLGSHIAIDSGVYITTALETGDYIHIAPYVTAIGGAKSRLKIGHFATISVGARMICGSDRFLGEGFTSTTVPEAYRDEVVYSTITLESFCAIATNAVIMPGVTIGEGGVIGACSFVNEDTEPWTIYVGTPAKPLRARKKEKMLAFARELGFTNLCE